MTSVDVIIVNYNTRGLLLACLESLRRYTGDYGTVFVVDNGSVDGSAHAVRERYPDVNLLESAENVGFARANNLAFEGSTAEFVLLLNSDAELRDGALEALMDALRLDEALGAVGPVLWGNDGRVQFEGGRRDPSIIGEFSNITHLNRRATSGPLAHYLMNEWDHLTTRDVEVLCGACMLLRRSALKGTLFRDDFFMYGEDVELSQRIRDNGYRLRYVAEAAVLHHGGASSKKARFRTRVAGVVSMAQLLGRRRGVVYAIGYLAMVPVALLVGRVARAVGRV